VRKTANTQIMPSRARRYVLLYLYVFNPNLTIAYQVVGNVHGSLEKRFPGVFH